MELSVKTAGKKKASALTTGAALQVPGEPTTRKTKTAAVDAPWWKEEFRKLLECSPDWDLERSFRNPRPS